MSSYQPSEKEQLARKLHYMKLYETVYPLDNYTVCKALSSVVGFQRYSMFNRCKVYPSQELMQDLSQNKLPPQLIGNYLKVAGLLTILNVAVNIQRSELCAVLGVSGKHFARVIRQYEEAGLFRITYPNGMRSKEVGKEIAYNIVFNPHYVFRGTKLAREGYIDYLNENGLQW